MTKRIRNLLNFLHLEKSSIPEHFKGQLHSFVEVISMVLAKKDQMEEMYTPLLQAETTHLPAEDLQHGRAETPVGKKPINRLIDAVSIKRFLTSLTVNAILQTILQNSVIFYLSSGAIFITSRA
jgi:hypothetical protein